MSLFAIFNRSRAVSNTSSLFGLLLGLFAVLSIAFVGCSQFSETTPVNSDAAEVTRVDASTSDSTKAGAELKVNGFYAVDAYDADRDPAEDLAATVELAQADNKRILLEIGGDW